MLSRLQLQSTSDQQDPLLYPPIAAAAPMSVLPEQAANWAYPQPDMSAEQIAFCLVTGMVGRLYLSGHIDLMRPEQRRLVADGVIAYQALRHEIARSVPFWPLGLPGWTDRWVSLGLRPDAGAGEGPTYLAIWRRPGASRELRCEIPHLAGRSVRPEIVYPAGLAPWTTSWDSGTGVLTVRADEPVPAARLIRLT
jgi:alpha-galactosidase